MLKVPCGMNVQLGSSEMNVHLGDLESRHMIRALESEQDFIGRAVIGRRTFLEEATT